MPENRKLIYVASPYRGDVKANIDFAKRMAMFVIENDGCPFVPHLMYPQFLDDNVEEERALGIELDCDIIAKCDELWAFVDNGLTEGMQHEIHFAMEHDIPVRMYKDMKCVEESE